MLKRRVKIVLTIIFLMPCLSFPESMNSGRSETEQPVCRIHTPLPQLSEQISMKFPLEIADSVESAGVLKLQRSLQTRSEFAKVPEQNTWVVLAVIAAVVTTIVVIRVAYGGS